MSFLPPAPDPLRQIGSILNLRNQLQSGQRQQAEQENREFNQALQLIQAGANPEVVLANTTLAPNRAALAREAGKVARKQQQAVEKQQQAAEQQQQQTAIQRRAGQLAPAIAPQVAQGQPPGLANLQLLEQAQQQFGPGFEQELRPLVAQQVAEFEPPEAQAGRTEAERLIADAERLGFENLSEFKQRRLDRLLAADDAELRATQLKAVVGSARFNDLIDTFDVTQNLIEDINDIRSVYDRNPAAAGLVGRIKIGASEAERILSDIFDEETADEITSASRSIVDGVLRGGNADPELEQRLFDISAKDFVTIGDAKFTIATLLAQQANPGGRLSDFDVRRQEGRVNAFFRSAESARAQLERLAKQAQRGLRQTQRRLEAFGRLGPDVKSLIDAQIGKTEAAAPGLGSRLPDSAPVNFDFTQ